MLVLDGRGLLNAVCEAGGKVQREVATDLPRIDRRRAGVRGDAFGEELATRTVTGELKRACQ